MSDSNVFFIVVVLLIAVFAVIVVILSKKLNLLRVEKERMRGSFEKQQNALEEAERIKKAQASNIDSLNKTIDDLNRKIAAIQQELDNYTKIEGDSKKLNEEDILPYDPTTINEEKYRLFRRLEDTSDDFFITGKAGTGKSYLLQYFRDHTSKKVLLCAPTGVAALNIGGVTLHSAFGFKNLETDDKITLSDNQIRLFNNLDTILIDEISMVRADVFARINLILQYANHSDEPFGGKQLVLFGDLFQLPPIADKMETRILFQRFGGVYFFHAPVYQSACFFFYELKEIFRLDPHIDGRFIDVLNRIRNNDITNADLDFLNKRYNPDCPPRIIRIVPKRDTADAINRQNLDNIATAKEYIYSSAIEVQPGEKEPKETDFPCALELHLKVGCLVMMIANDTQYDRWVNGTLGIISYLSNDTVKVMIDGVEYEINKHNFTLNRCVFNEEEQQIEYKEVANVTQYPLVLSYAITIHKAQGKTYQQIACDLSGCFADGQAYVALSRVSSYEGLNLLHRISNRDIKSNEEVQKFYNDAKQAEIEKSRIPS